MSLRVIGVIRDSETVSSVIGKSNALASGGDTTVLAIDPGRAKCGVAVVRRDGQVLFRAIVAVEEIVEETQRLIADYSPCALIVGGGTGSRPVLQALRAAEMSVAMERVDEAHTSEAARARFVAENPAPGWQRLLPRSLRTPWRLYDDYVAIILAERYWQKQNSPSP